MPYNQNENNHAYGNDEPVQDINPQPIDDATNHRTAYSGPTYSRPGGNDFQEQPPRPSNYLVWAIVATVLGCGNCLPFVFGIIAIVYAAKVNKLYDSGRVQEAYAASHNAKIWCIVASVLIVLGFIAGFIMGLTGYTTTLLQQMQHMSGAATY